jgi:hypothetical protein
VAKRIPAGWRLLFVLHYVPIGTPQQDQTSIGLRLVAESRVRKELATKVLMDEELRIPPRAADYVVGKEWRVDADMLLYSMFPHMHLRGRSFRYELEYPDQKREILLSVPCYDFNWQHRYVLVEPKRLPAGSVLHCIAHYDNSARNPNNPDPSALVLAGEKTTDEMFNGYFDVTLADQDLVAEANWRRIAALICIASVNALGVAMYRQRARMRAESVAELVRSSEVVGFSEIW